MICHRRLLFSYARLSARVKKTGVYGPLMGGPWPIGLLFPEGAVVFFVTTSRQARTLIYFTPGQKAENPSHY
jgi:hypothetical protein